MSTLNSAKKPKGRPRKDSEAVNVRLDRPVLNAIDQIIAAESDPKPSRPDIIRRILEEKLSIKP